MTHVLTARGRQLLLDDEPFEMWGLRLANSLEDDWHTDQLIAHLDEYKSYGINAFSVFLQGAKTGSANAFQADGSLIAEYMDRLARIIEAADQRRMVVNVGYLYQARPSNLPPEEEGLASDTGAPRPREWPRDVFQDGEALRQGIVNATQWLRDQGYANVFIDVANEFNVPTYRFTKPMFDVSCPERMRELIHLVHQTYPGLLVGASPTDVWYIYRGIGDVEGVILVHGLPTHLKQQVIRHYPDKPVIENESGNWLGCLDRYASVGVFTGEMKATFKADAQAMHEAGEYWFLFTRWQQKVPMHFDLGGYGTPDDPGVRWMFEFIRQLSRRGSK